MANEDRLIRANALIEMLPSVEHDRRITLSGAVADFICLISNAPTVDAVEVPDKELLRAIKLLIKQYEHSKNSEYVHSPVAHALYHTWKQVEERRTAP